MLRTLLARFLPGSPASAPAPADSDALVQVYLRAGRLYIEPSHRTRNAEAGFWVASGEVKVLEGDAADATLGVAVLEAIARSRVEVPVPPRDAKLEAALFRAMGVRSRRAAMTGTRSCLVTRETTPVRALQVEALHNGGTRGDGRGWRGLQTGAAPAADAITTLPIDAAGAAVGAAVRSALQRATIAG